MENKKDFNYYVNVFELLDKSDDKESFIKNNKNYIDFFCNDFLFSNIDSLKNKNVRNIISKILKNDLYDQSYYDKLFNFINNIEEDEFEKIIVCKNQNELNEIIDILNWKELIIKNINFNSEYIEEFKSNNLFLVNIVIDSMMYSFSRNNISEFNNLSDIITNSLTFNTVIDKNSRELNFEEVQLLVNYIKSVLSINSVFDINKLKNDRLVNKFFKLELDNEYLVLELMKVIPKKVIKEYVDNCEKLIENFDCYLKSNTDSMRVCNIYMDSLIKTKIDLLDYEKFYNDYILDSDKNILNKFCWMNDFDVKTKFKQLEDKILNGENALLDCELAVKLINKFFNEKSCYNSVFMNLYQLVKSNKYYSENEEKIILEAFKNKKSNFYYEKNELFDTNSIVGLKNKSINSFLKGNIIDLNLAKKLLRENINGNIELGLYSTKAIMQSIIINYLSSIGIDIGGVFFFNSETLGGTCDFNNNIIYLNNKLVNNFCNKNNTLLDRINIFITAFHEMTHIIQRDSINRGIFSDNYYTTLKECIISDQDDDFYDNNYDKLVLELDANVSSYKKTVKFFEGIDEKFAISIQKEIMTLYKDILEECKNDDNMIVASNSLKLNMEDILSIIVKNNPLILKRYSVLELEYNFDGSKKSILDSLKFLDKNCFNNIDEYFNILKVKIISCLKNNVGINNIFIHNFKRKEIIDFVNEIKLMNTNIDIKNNFRK